MMRQPVVITTPSPSRRGSEIVGQAILPAAAFQAALLGEVRTFGKRRLKAGGSQDWLPHVSPEPVRMVRSR
jgi:hypothetical protein